MWLKTPSSIRLCKPRLHIHFLQRLQGILLIHFCYTFVTYLGFPSGSSLAVPHTIRDVDPDDPFASDPKAPPSSLKDPPRPQPIGETPFVSKSVTVPGSCDNLWNPSEQCIRDIEAHNNDAEAYASDFKFEDGSCNNGQKLALEIAV